MPVASLLLASSRLNTRMPSFNKWQSLGGAMLLATTVLSVRNFSIDKTPCSSQCGDSISCIASLLPVKNEKYGLISLLFFNDLS